MNEAVTVLLIGCFHFDNPGRDQFNLVVDDVKAARRQREVEELVSAMAEFQPTKVAVEVDVNKQAELQRDYEAFLASSFDLPPDEEYQLGFRLAKGADLRSVAAVNVMIGSEIDPWSYAKEHGQTELLDRMTRGWQAMLTPQEKMLANGTVSEVLALMNTPERRRREHELYLELAAIGDDSQHAGADWLAGWYQRNLVIYSNLRRISAGGDRLIVIYGAGHIPWLRTLFEWTPGCDLEEPEGYLRRVQPGSQFG